MGVLKEAKDQYNQEIRERITQLIDELSAISEEVYNEQLYNEYCNLMASIDTACDIIEDALKRL